MKHYYIISYNLETTVASVSRVDISRPRDDNRVLFQPPERRSTETTGVEIVNNFNGGS